MGTTAVPERTTVRLDETLTVPPAGAVETAAGPPTVPDCADALPGTNTKLTDKIAADCINTFLNMVISTGCACLAHFGAVLTTVKGERTYACESSVRLAGGTQHRAARRSRDPNQGLLFCDAVRRYRPGLRGGALSPGHAGIRPKVSGPGEPADVIIQGPRETGSAG